MKLICRMQKTNEPYSMGPAEGIVNYYRDPAHFSVCIRWSRHITHGHCWFDFSRSVGVMLECWFSPKHGYYKELRWV